MGRTREEIDREIARHEARLPVIADWLHRLGAGIAEQMLAADKAEGLLDFLTEQRDVLSAEKADIDLQLKDCYEELEEARKLHVAQQQKIAARAHVVAQPPPSSEFSAPASPGYAPSSPYRRGVRGIIVPDEVL